MIHKAKIPAYDNFEGKYVILKQLHKTDIQPLYEKTHGSNELEQVWQFLPYGPFTSNDEMELFYRSYLMAEDKLGFCIHDINKLSPIGITCLEDINPDMATVEIGSVLYCKPYQKTEANTETVYLLIRHCIENLGYRRITWRCNNENIASKNAALRLGFEFEGIFHNHMIVKGQNRDTAWFGLIDKRWPIISENIKEWLYEDSANRVSLRDMNRRSPSFSNIGTI